MSPKELSKKTVAELKKLASELNISGVTSKSTKANIVELISAASNPTEAKVEEPKKAIKSLVSNELVSTKKEEIAKTEEPKEVMVKGNVVEENTSTPVDPVSSSKTNQNKSEVPEIQPASNLNPKLAPQTANLHPNQLDNSGNLKSQQVQRPQNNQQRPQHNNQRVQNQPRPAQAPVQPNQSNGNQNQNFSNEATVEITGILEIMSDGTHGVLRSPRLIPTDKDTYISISQVKKLKLRKGDVVTGVARLPKENERYFSLLWIKTVNNTPIDQLKDRPNFDDLKPVYPNKQMKLEIGAHPVANRVIDLMSPIGFGQRAMIVAPPKAGKTTLLKDIAKGINENHPDIQLIVVLIGERPEEVTDIERSVNGIVYASNFDDSPSNQVAVAELSLERAKRMVEAGQDVIILMDSLTRLARAYNVALPASGRTLSGGLDPVSLYPSKRFFGAARNFENGASLTIVATSLVETGSKMDDVIFEEFKGTGNMELKLDRKLANKRVFPAIDLLESGTRNEELLLSPEILQDSWKLRRMLESLGQDASEALIDRMKGTKTNEEFLRTIHQY